MKFTDAEYAIIMHPKVCGRPRCVRAVLPYLPWLANAIQKRAESEKAQKMMMTFAPLIGARSVVCLTCQEAFIMSRWEKKLFRASRWLHNIFGVQKTDAMQLLLIVEDDYNMLELSEAEEDKLGMNN